MRKFFLKKALDNDISLKEIANRLNISKTTLTNKLTEKQQFKLSELEQLRDILNLTDEEVLNIVFRQYD